MLVDFGAFRGGNSIEIHSNENQMNQGIMADTTIQESNLTYPTDGKLAIKNTNYLHKIVKS